MKAVFSGAGGSRKKETESGKGDTAVIRIFRTTDGAIREIQEPQDGCWIALTNPTATEIFEISEQFQRVLTSGFKTVDHFFEAGSGVREAV